MKNQPYWPWITLPRSVFADDLPFTDTIMIIFPCISQTYHLLLTYLITEWVYLDDELAVIILVDCRSLTVFMTSCILAPNVLTSMGIP